MLLGNRILAVVASLAIGLLIAGGASALSLADLVVSGESFSAGNGISYENFWVRIKGKGLIRDLSKYEVLPTADGFQLLGNVSEDPKGGKIRLAYDVIGSGIHVAGIAGDAGVASSGKLKVKEKLVDAMVIDILRISLEKGTTSDSALFPAVDSLRVKEKIRIKGDYFLDGSGSSVTHSFSASPEPTTALMLAAGLAGLAAAGRRRSR